MTETIIHLVILLLCPPLLLGVINRVKAMFAGRKGPPLIQAYYDLFKLTRKGTSISTTATWMFLAGPSVSAVSTFIAGLLIPLAAPAVLFFPGDFILVAYLFALGRFFTSSAALDTGSSFEGMGAAREVTFAAFSEPAFFMGAFLLVRLSGSSSLSDMLSHQIFQEHAVASLLLLGISWFIILLAENSRIPFDDPNTHLELTMIHEVMVLDHGGPALALVEYGSAMKLFLLSAMFLQVLVPLPPAWGLWKYPAFLALVIAVGVMIGAVESSIARVRLNSIPRLLITASLFSFFGFVLLLRK